MEKLPMCRICLVQNVRMFIVVNRNWHELYERLTDFPFVTEDRRPILACFFCCAKLKQCYRLLRQSLEAERLFAKMMNEDYEPNPFINQDQFEFYSGFTKSPTETISIVDERQTESNAIKEELPAVCEGLDDIIETQEEHQSDEVELENLDNSCLDVADIPPHHSGSDLEDDVPLTEFKTKIVKKQVAKKKRRSKEAKRATGAAKPNTRRRKQEDAITAEQTKKVKSNSIVIRTTQKRTSIPGTYLKEPYKCNQRSSNGVKKVIQQTRTQIGDTKWKHKCDVCQRSFSRKRLLINHIRIHTGEKPYKCDICQRSFSEKGGLSKHTRIHTGEKPYKCDVCQRSFRGKDTLTKHFRIHTGEKCYRCDVCQRSFREKGNLTKHIRIHTGEKPYKCHVCQRNFTEKGNLTKHILFHNERKERKKRKCVNRHCSKKYTF